MFANINKNDFTKKKFWPNINKNIGLKWLKTEAILNDIYKNVKQSCGKISEIMVHS